MFYAFLGLILINLFSSCAEKIQPPEDFFPCLSQESRSEIYKSLLHFETAIDKIYGKESIYENTLDYLTDMETMNLPKELFLDKAVKNSLRNLKETGVYDEVFVTKRMHKGRANEYLFIDLNFKQKYIECFLNECKNNDVIEMINALSQTPNISRSLVAGGIKISLENESLLTTNYRSFIALYLHYAMVLNLDRRSK